MSDRGRTLAAAVAVLAWMAYAFVAIFYGRTAGWALGIVLFGLAAAGLMIAMALIRRR